MPILLIGFILLLSSCGHVQPKPVEVGIPIVQPCLTSRPVLPIMKFDSLPKAKTDSESAEQVRVLWNDRQALLDHVIEWQKAASGCQVVQ